MYYLLCYIYALQYFRILLCMYPVRYLFKKRNSSVFSSFASIYTKFHTLDAIFFKKTERDRACVCVCARVCACERAIERV